MMAKTSLILLFLVALLYGSMVSQVRAVGNFACRDADIDASGVVDISDYAVLAREIFKQSFSPLAVDITKDGAVDISDFSILASFIFDSCPTPSPTATAVASPGSSPTSTPVSTPTATPDVANLPAFPGAEGFGAKTKGGRGGKILRVTNTNDSGPGSLRQAMELETGPRTIVFATGGTIELTKPLKLVGANASYVTIAGQTAPGDGIQLKNYGIHLYHGVHDVVIRHLRIRIGQRSDYNFSDDVDGIEMWGGTAPVYNVMVDHMSLQWALDENSSIYDKVYDVTYQYSLIAESSNNGQDHRPAKGLLVGNDDPNKLPNNISMHHNVFAHNFQRNPRIAFADTDFRNNIIYNWGEDNSTTFGNYQDQLQSLSQPTRVNLVNNIWKRGPSVRAAQRNMLWVNKGAQLFVQGNWGTDCPTGCGSDEWKIGVREEFEPYNAGSESKYRKMQPFAFGSVTTHETSSLFDVVLPQVGASMPKRDAVDARITQEVISGTGATGIHGSFPTLVVGTAPADADQDGIPDAWEQQKGLNKNSKDDALQLAPSGYPWIEEYINSIGQ